MYTMKRHGLTFYLWGRGAYRCFCLLLTSETLGRGGTAEARGPRIMEKSL